MPKSTSSVNLDLEDLLVSKGYKVTYRDSSGDEVPTADTAELQQFHFHREGKDYGTVTISIDGLKNMTVYYDDEIAGSGVNEDDMDGDRGMNGTSWISLVKQLKKFAQRHQLGFVLKDAGRLRIDMKRRSQTEKELREGAELKRVKREYNQAAKNSGGDWDGAGKKIDNMKKGLRQKDIGKDKTVAESSESKDNLIDTLNNFDYYTEDSKVYVNDKTGDKIVRVGSEWKHQSGKRGRGAEELGAFLSSKSSVAEGNDDHIWGPQGRFAGDTPVNLGGDTVKAIQVGDTVTYLGQKAEVVAMSKDRKRARITIEKGMGGVTQDVNTSDLKRVNLDEDWKKWAATGAMALGVLGSAGGAQARVMPGDDPNINRLTGQPIASQQATDTATPQVQAPKGYSKEYLQKAADPNRFGRYMISVEKAQELLKNMQENRKNSGKQLDEGYYGNRKMSYSDDTPTVKMVIKHNRQLEETDQRFRHIEKIFLETSDGERFGVPTTKPSRARMFARHIAEGGGYKDERWNHISEISEDIDALGGFIRATRSSDQFNESAQRMIGEAAEKYRELRETAKRLQSGRGYNSYFESYEPATQIDNDDDLLEVFKHSSVDRRIEEALPTLNKLGIRRGKLEEADIFEQWADSIIDESLDIDSDRQSNALIQLFSDELPIGPNAEVVIGELTDIIEDNDLFARLRRVAAVDPNSDARPQIIAWMQEQDDPKYRELLSKLDADDQSPEAQSPEAPQEPEVEQPQAVEPEAVPPEPEVEQPPQDDAEAADGSTPPLKESTDSLNNIKRLSGL